MQITVIFELLIVVSSLQGLLGEYSTLGLVHSPQLIPVMEGVDNRAWLGREIPSL